MPEEGVEPSRLAAYAPEAYVYSHFTTPARTQRIVTGLKDELKYLTFTHKWPIILSCSGNVPSFPEYLTLGEEGWVLC